MNSRIFRMPDPIRLSIFSKDVYIVQGAENIKHVFRNSWTSTSTVIHKFSLRNAFGMADKALEIYDKDDSGGSLRPYPGSTVEARNRVDFKTYQNIARFLAGSGFAPFWRRYHTDVTKRLKGHTLGSEWEHWPDFLGFFETEISTATVNALCGKYLLKRSPNFLKDFWKMDREAGVLFKGTPRIFAPKVYATRDRLLAAIKDWQAFARQNFHPSTVEPSGDDPFWGSSFFRDRQGVFMDMDGMDYDAIASEDFGAIWASVRNAIVAAFWTTLEIFQDPALLTRVREELKVCRNDDPDTLFDIDRLLQSHLMQSIYAEVLRLRVHVFIVRAPKKYNLKIRDWFIPAGKTLFMSSTPAHMDKNVWNTGASDEHGLDTFWADRFMKAAGDETSGPRKHNMRVKSPSTPVHDPHTASQAKFAPEDVEGSWIPYGGGPRMCPGRHFAKREIILTAAMMVSLFDCEVLADVRSLKMDMKGYGLGTLNAAGKVPVRMKRRNIDDE
ncbi:cytochrome P450 [Aspergillus melleus]|uniref:cytochrome P450 n=1 Tax=Aspergillus melleus TaxID=138277 RepID=UPI001E8D0A0A|nr:uncharacterized protein LDX57_011126 [Aspergillus melleus]KAH8433492.1 hypothetical protein LDX57_011126 [Aspergillus melleus]